MLRRVTTWVIGDVQGCALTLRALLSRIDFRPSRDRLVLLGDLVNRGPGSLDALRWLRDVGEAAELVLGNHDLHLLARAAGVAKRRPRDTLEPILEAHDREALLDGLRRRPLLVDDGVHLFVHAGLPPGWSLETLRRRASAVESRLRAPDWRRRMASLWTGRDRVDLEDRDTVAALTRMRMVDPKGLPVDGFSGPPEQAPRGLGPWFLHPAVAPGRRVFFGHWAALGRRISERWVALDSGCVWGGELSAFALESESVVSLRCLDPLDRGASPAGRP
jgi:bis(5'-nucleosyl)-tetraphosphatase (symmetrical)